MKRVHLIPAVFCALLLLAQSITAAQQSPVDISSNNALFAGLPALQFAYASAAALDVVNTGSPDEFATIRANVPAGAGAVTLAGVRYNLLQFHFHTEAENLLNGHRAAMELHFVHQAADGSLLVVGRWIEPGPTNSTLQTMFANLPTNPGDHVPLSGFNIAALLPTTFESFRFPGSLTTPPFSEGVKWNVLPSTLFLSQSQIDAFRTIFPGGNSREAQALDGRVIVTDVPGFAGLPQPTGLTIVNCPFVSQQPAGGARSFVTYSADLVNPGTALGAVSATATSLDPFTIRTLPGLDTVRFAPVPANGLVSSSNTFTILTDATVPLDYTKLQWTFQTVAAPPVAKAGSNQTVSVGSTVVLDGSSSSNLSGSGTLTYNWMFTSRPSGTKAVLFYTTSSTVSFVADVPGVYVLQLIVSNGTASATTSVTVTAV